MTVDSAAQTIWDYMLMHQELKKADVIFVPGHPDLRVPEYAAKLFKEGWAPIVICSGSGTINKDLPDRTFLKDSTEGALFKRVMMGHGVPESAILVEEKSQSTNDNLRLSLDKLAECGVYPKKIIAVVKPYVQRRMLAIAGLQCPNIECVVTSPNISLEEYPFGDHTKDWVINMIVGDLQRIIEYPKKGWQIAQEIPPDVMAAYDFLVSKGYTERLIKQA